MTGKLFVLFMNKMNNHYRLQNCKVAIILDNCSAYPCAQLNDFSNISVYFLQPNTTSASQPMDTGIIKNLKVLYKKHLVCLEDNSQFSWTLLDVLFALKSAWDDVKPSTIANWFAKTGFVQSTEPAIPDVPIPDLDEFTNLFERMAAMFSVEVRSYRSCVYIYTYIKSLSEC